MVARFAEVLRRSEPRPLRRIDVVYALCEEVGRACELAFSDPWVHHPDILGEALPKRTTRDVGAVLMFFFSCPNGVNCKMGWANTHAHGMQSEHALLGFGARAAGYYAPSEAGFWRRELVDGRYAGLDFFLLNVYGPDVEHGKLTPLVEALAALGDPPKIALMDDPWAWGTPWFGEHWKQKPDLADPERAADLIYESKWRPFYAQVPKEHWYRFKGRPFVYFYNAGTLEPRRNSAKLIARLKSRFRADHGEDAFVAAEQAYFEDAALPEVADASFQWFTFDLAEQKSRSALQGHVIDHAMVKWDAVGRDGPGRAARAEDLVLKDTRPLERVLERSRDADILVLATWNDLGEGTGIHRNYDYYFDGAWQRPDVFLRLIRAAQSQP
jgi:hypothetical protein